MTSEQKILIGRRDLLLASLRTQFATKVAGVIMADGDIAQRDSAPLDSFLRDLANNLAQALPQVAPEPLTLSGTDLADLAEVDVDYRDLLRAKLRAVNMNAWLEHEAVKLGNESQRERYDARELGEEDLLGLARDEVFQNFSRFTRWQPIKWSAVEHMPWCKPIVAAHRVDLSVATVTEEIDHPTYVSIVEIAAMLAQYHPWFMKAGTAPNVEVRRHMARCTVCGDEIVALSALVSTPWAGRILSREYAL